jgi:two-component system chemotaxis response regulator CheB
MAKKVLIVDDSFMMRTLIKDIIKVDPELEVVGEAADGKIALEKVKELSPHVILLDIEMPNMDGIEFMQHLKPISKAKVVVISSVALPGTPKAKEVTQLGAVEIIGKPSGAMSLDLKAKKGSDIAKATRRAAGLLG